MENEEMKIIPDKDRDMAVTEAADVIRKGGTVAFPTETFYGLGVKYDDFTALKRLYDLKQRPKDKAISLILGDKKALELIAATPGKAAERIMERFWPGPLTVLFKAKKGLSEFLTAGTGKVAARMPGNSFALDLCRLLGFPVTATSANVSGLPPADNPGDVIRYFREGLDLLIDGGRTHGGRPSTIIDVTDEKIVIVRQGAIPDEELREFLTDK